MPKPSWYAAQGLDDERYIWNEGRVEFYCFHKYANSEELEAIKSIRLARPGRHVGCDYNAEWLEEHLFSRFINLQHVIFLHEDIPFDHKWITEVTNAVASKKAEDPIWVAPTWEFEVLGGRDRISSDTEAL